MKRQKKIIHVDMDCFYAAVEVRDNPRFNGQPVAVGGRPGERGVLTTANYEARKFGVKSAMSVTHALKLCPHLQLAPINFSKYKHESHKIRQIFQNYTDLIQPLSLDEAYLDVTNYTQLNGSASLIAEQIRKDIFAKTKLTASAGIAPNKFLAKVASDWRKPNGQFTIAPHQILDFVSTLPVNKIPGVGKVTTEKMHKNNIYTCMDLQKYSVSELSYMFGSWGISLYDISRGIDHRPVTPAGERKSLSTETTFSEDLTTLNSCLEKLPTLYKRFLQQLEIAGIDERIKSLFVKVKFEDFKVTTLDCSLKTQPSMNNFSQLIEQACSRHNKAVRLLGLGVRLHSAVKPHKKTSQLSLFQATDS